MNKPTLLFVDDEKQILSALRRSLRSEPYEMRFAESAEAALDILASEPVFLTVSDLNMPGTNGIELLETVAEKYPETGRVLMSGNADLPSLIEALNKGLLTYYFEKPWSTEGLRLALGELVERIELEKNNRKLVETIRHQNEALIRQSEIQHRFFATMSHEIRTPLNGVFGMLQILDQSELPTADKEMVRTAIASAEHLSQIVNDVLDFSKIEAGEFELNRRSFPFKVLLSEVLASLKPLADSKKLALLLEADKIQENFHVLGDDLRLRQILINLIGNAIKFTEEGSVTLRVASCKDGEQVLQVIDTGVGIPESELPNLFEAYQQVASAAAKEEGSGLGLAIASQLTQLMDGELTVNSVEGTGTTFSIQLQLPEAAPIDEQDAVDQSAGYSGCRFLVVDDNPTNRLIVRAMLEQLEAEVDDAESGEEIIRNQRTAPKRYDLIFMDISMGGIDGIETLKILNSESLIPRETPVIAMSAHVQPEEQARFLSNGMTGFLGKPFNRDDLLTTLSNHVLVSGHDQAAGISFIDKEIFESLKSSVGPDAMNAMVASFETDATGREEKIKAHLTSEDWQALAAEAHALGSSAGMFGAMSLHQTCRDLETAFKIDEMDKLPDLANKLCDLIKPSLEAAADLLD